MVLQDVRTVADLTVVATISDEVAAVTQRPAPHTLVRGGRWTSSDQQLVVLRSSWTLAHATRPPNLIINGTPVDNLTAGASWAVWAVAKVALQRDCYNQLRSTERTRGGLYAGFIYIRVDWEWMPG
eukprot:800094-Prymnesium_polylepis.1